MTFLSHDTEAIAERLAAARQMSVDEAVRQALDVWARAGNFPREAREAEDLSPAALAERKASTDRAVSEISALLVLDPMSPMEIVDDLDLP